MGLVVATTAALCLWIIMWATLGLSGLDSIVVVSVIVLMGVIVHNLLPSLPGRRD